MRLGQSLNQSLLHQIVGIGLIGVPAPDGTAQKWDLLRDLLIKL